MPSKRAPPAPGLLSNVLGYFKSEIDAFVVNATGGVANSNVSSQRWCLMVNPRAYRGVVGRPRP
jgi:hypothetical protein